MFIKNLSVTQANNYIKKIIDNDFILNNLCVKGELSNFKLHSSGHLYFSLKDENSKVNCVMFRNYAENIDFIPQNGMMVTVKGRASIYTKDGTYAIYCSEMNDEGTGNLYREFERLKKKLAIEGIFDESHKKTIPQYPQKIGVITSPTGAAIRDIINVTKRRNKMVELIIYPSLVQGACASEDVIKGIERFNYIKGIDVIILARGGGSMEELWAFNDEKLAHAIYDSKIPVITGIGHETDYTIADFASDKRAPTPSAAAEIAVFNLSETENIVQKYKQKIEEMIGDIIKDKYKDLSVMRKNLEYNSPSINIINEYNNIDNLVKILKIRALNNLERNKEKLSKANSLLISHNPLNILNKGYSVIQSESGEIINKIEVLKKNSSVNITLSDGKVKAFMKYKDNSYSAGGYNGKKG